MSTMIRVLLADDQALLRGTFRMLFDATEDMETVAEASNGREAVELVGRAAPRCGPDGHPHAGDGRPRGDTAHHRV